MIKKETVNYSHAGRPIESLFVYDSEFTFPRPCVLLFHEWMGLGNYMNRHAEFLVRAGYAVFAADMYGRGIRPRNEAEARIQADRFRPDRPFMRERAMAAFNAIRNMERVDISKVAAVGYSFGGCSALELARHKAPLKGAVSFYGYLNTTHPVSAGDVEGKILVLHGALDPVVPMDDLVSFSREMSDARIDARIVIYSRGAHGFSNPALGTDISTGSAYDEEIDRNSRELLLSFLDDIFAEDE